ncbi:MAG: hypothetical protein M0Z83_03405 [Betaproteobacteria bacterium]|nr:hypothetical protein [Betaproteobacteria bacterium]
MKHSRSCIKTLLFGLGFIALPTLAHADAWSFTATPNTTQGTYSSSQQRSTFADYGIGISADYLDQGGIQVSYSNTLIGETSGLTNINQNNYMVSGHLNFHPDALPGQVTVRLDDYVIDNNYQNTSIQQPNYDPTSRSNVVATQISWLNNDKTLYADLGYANSPYQGFTVQQYTPTFGFAFDQAYDWLQLRGYMISGLQASTAGKTSTNALETKWTHFFVSQSAWVPSSVTVGITLGEQDYAVNMDAQQVANLADLSQGADTIGLNWNLSKSTKLFVLGGQSRFRYVAGANDYQLNFGYAGLTYAW